MAPSSATPRKAARGAPAKKRSGATGERAGASAGSGDRSTPDAAAPDGPEARIGTPAQGRELRARGRHTMRKLLDAGVEVFSERGYHAARVDDIVKLARTSHGTFYLYFSNKEDLFRALAADVAQQMVGLAEDLPPVGPGEEGYLRLRQWLARFGELYERFGPVVRAWTEAEIGDSAFGRLGQDVLTEFSRVLAARIRSATPSDVDPQIAALALAAMIERFHYYVLAGHVRVPDDVALDTLARVTHIGLFGGEVGLARAASAS
ncbi:MAG: TetR/AcrR family transcriptional regulator [Acidimicrobiia bacterium]|nr:TetR/AcrR family transcriptional regulator [Acidimicrobiia bacterium]